MVFTGDLGVRRNTGGWPSNASCGCASWIDPQKRLTFWFSASKDTR